MAMNGYPNPTDRVLRQQLDIWDVIQAHNSTLPADVAAGWCTDPQGLEGCLMALNPPPGQGDSWVVFSNPSAYYVMFSILYWMNRLYYPVPVLINEGGHWVLIVGYESDVQPLDGTAPTLQFITYYDPEPHNVGSVITKTGAQWFTGPWIGPVNWSGSWLDNYVAVIEPPSAQGKVKVAERVKRVGEKIIAPSEAADYAKKWIDKFKLAEKPRYRILAKTGIMNLSPILVREELRPGMETAKVPYYYVVPFGLENDRDQRDLPLARVCVIVNAYTGDFEEVGSFGKPVSYLPEKDAIAIATRALHLKPEAALRAKAALMFQPSEITHIRIYPFWKVTINERVLYIDQLGKLYKAIIPSNPGD
jgi:hypothetical protein